MLAARGGHGPLCSHLLSERAVIDASDSQGWTSLCFAADGGHGKVARILLEAGADPDVVTKEGLTPAELAGNTG
jgi:ankyrin repeat protein